MFDTFWAHGIVRRAIENKKIFASETGFFEIKTRKMERFLGTNEMELEL